MGGVPIGYTEGMVRVFRALPVERLKLLVFDLDGTLIDSAQDLCNSVNAALEHAGLAPLPDPLIASYVGNGVPMLMRRSLAQESGIAPEQVDEELLTQATAFFPGVLPRAQAGFYLRLRGSSGGAGGAEGTARCAGWNAADDGGADQQAGAPGAGHLRGAGAGRLLFTYLRGRQLPDEEAGSDGPALADGGDGRNAGGNGDDWRQPGRRGNSAKRRCVVDRMPVWIWAAKPDGHSSGCACGPCCRLDGSPESCENRCAAVEDSFLCTNAPGETLGRHWTEARALKRGSVNWIYGLRT